MPKIVDEERIFAAAANMLISLGYDGSTTKAIAEAAGVNEVTLFRKYGSKAILFEKAIGYQLRDTPLNRIRFSGDIEADLREIVRAYVETNETHGDVVAIILIELPRNPDLQGLIRTPMRNIGGILEVIERYQAQGKLKKEPPLAALGALVGPLMINLMFRRAKLEFPVPPIDAQAHVACFLQGRGVPYGPTSG